MSARHPFYAGRRRGTYAPTGGATSPFVAGEKAAPFGSPGVGGIPQGDGELGPFWLEGQTQKRG